MTNLTIRPYQDLARDARLLDGLDAIFFEASNTKSFAGAAERAAFRERWLGRYLAHDPAAAFLAIDEAGNVAGYVAGCFEDPARMPRFSDIAYFSKFAELSRDYPAHLHVNIAERHRNRGLGARLIDAFAAAAKDAGARGVHVVTSLGARNVRFYERNGFMSLGRDGEPGREIVFLARRL